MTAISFAAGRTIRGESRVKRDNLRRESSRTLEPKRGSIFTGDNIRSYGTINSDSPPWEGQVLERVRIRSFCRSFYPLIPNEIIMYKVFESIERSTCPKQLCTRLLNLEWEIGKNFISLRKRVN